MKFFNGLYLTYLCFFDKEKFIEEENSHNKLYTDKIVVPSVYLVRKALYSSFILVLISGGAGLLTSQSLACFFGSPDKSNLTSIQAAGTLILLWATLAVRGFDIQTWSGVTLTECVNRWIYQFLYCCGTLLLMVSIFWK